MIDGRFVRSRKSLATRAVLGLHFLAASVIGCDSGARAAEQARIAELERRLAAQDAERRTADAERQRRNEEERTAQRNAEAQAEAARLQTRDAIRTFFIDMNAQLAEFYRSHPTRTPEEARSALTGFHGVLLNLNTTSCPADFRVQFQTVVRAARELADAAQQVPADELEYLAYIFQQGGTNNVDLSGQRAVMAAAARREAFVLQLNELGALAKSYGVQ